MFDKFGGLGIGRMSVKSRIHMYKGGAPPLIMLFCWSLLLLRANTQTPITHPQEGTIFFCFFTKFHPLYFIHMFHIFFYKHRRKEYRPLKYQFFFVVFCIEI